MSQLSKNDKKLLSLAFIIFLLLIILLNASYTVDKYKVEGTKNLNQNTENLADYFHISKEYFVQWHNAKSLTFRVEYPAMRPNIPSYDFSKTKTIRIYIRSIAGYDEVNTFLQHVYTDDEKSCHESVCYARKIETTPEYEVFRHGSDNDLSNKSGKASDYYLFEAYDKQKILLEDKGNWAETYLVKRNLNKFFIIQYQFPKSLAKHLNIDEKIRYDFKEIDENVTKFIKKHIVGSSDSQV